jgi:hypothetical protein
VRSYVTFFEVSWIRVNCFLVLDTVSSGGVYQNAPVYMISKRINANIVLCVMMSDEEEREK